MEKPVLNRGFSLLELLVVIAIIGILLSVGAASYSVAQQKSRDSRRRSDMKAVQNAFEQYYLDNNSYPPTIDPCSLGASQSKYLPGGWPVDPKPATNYYTISCLSSSSYCACAQMEGIPGNGNANDANCGGFGAYSSTKQFVCVKNLQ